MSLNRAMVIGYLGSDPELRSLPSGQPVVSFSVATDEFYTDKQDQKQERVEWHHVVAFGRLAEICKEYLQKGRQVFVEGRFRTVSTRSKTTAANASAPRSSPAACSSLARHRQERLR
jgi:single-strand DNA-binding protein